MTEWIPDSFTAIIKHHGVELRLDLSFLQTISPEAAGWYWHVRDNDKIVAEGYRPAGGDNFSGMGPAKSACSRAAKKYSSAKARRIQAQKVRSLDDGSYFKL
jgi:hypothetical protein